MFQSQSMFEQPVVFDGHGEPAYGMPSITNEQAIAANGPSKAQALDD